MAFHIMQLGPGSNEQVVRETRPLRKHVAEPDTRFETFEGDQRYDTLRDYW